jgi:hypothetical protein
MGYCLNGSLIEAACVAHHLSTAKLEMAPGKKTWNMLDGSLLTTNTMGAAAQQEKNSDDLSSLSASSQRSVSSTSTSSTASAFSDSPLVDEKLFIKVPLHVAASLAHRGFDVSAVGKVTWRKSSPLHPRNWSLTRKIYDAAVICFLELFTTLVSNTGSSTATAGAADLGVSKGIALICFTATYLLAQAVGGLVLPPVAETFGGRNLYIFGAFGFTLSCVLMAAHPTLPVVVAGRLVCGFMSALPSTVAVSSFENMFDFRARIWVFHIWMCCAVSALGIGPAVATYISTSSLGW